MLPGPTPAHHTRVVQSATTVGHADGHAPEMVGCSAAHQCLRHVSPSIHECWTCVGSGSTHGWKDGRPSDTQQPCNSKGLSIRVVCTISLVLPPSFLYLELFPTKWANKSTLGNNWISTMFGTVVLMHDGSTCILLLTHRACHLVTLHTHLCVLCPHPSGCKNLPTLTTWEFLSPVDTHMNSYSVVQFEDLLAHRAGCLSSGDSQNLVWHLSDFPGLRFLWQVFTTKKGQHLLLDMLQSPLLHHHFILSCLELCQNQSRLHLQSRRSPKLHLETLGVGSKPSASSSLVSPTAHSSSVSEGWRIFHQDTFSSEHSHTDFNRLQSASLKK